MKLILSILVSLSSLSFAQNTGATSDGGDQKTTEGATVSTGNTTPTGSPCPCNIHPGDRHDPDSKRQLVTGGGTPANSSDQTGKQ